MGQDVLRLAQFANNGNNMNLIAAGKENRPEDIVFGSSNWQRWAIAAIRKLIVNGKFHGSDIVAMMPASEMSINNMKIPGIRGNKSSDAVLLTIKDKLAINLDQTMVKYIASEEDNVLVTSAERKKIDRHLAIYEQANLRIKSICAWPIALINAYTSFFGRRQSDTKSVAMLIDMDANYSNVVICRHKKLLFAKSILTETSLAEIGETDEMVERFATKLTACIEYFGSIYKNIQVDRLVFFCGSNHAANERGIYVKIAKFLGIPAQLGDCLAAVEIDSSQVCGIERRDSEFSWAIPFGLSLS